MMIQGSTSSRKRSFGQMSSTEQIDQPQAHTAISESIAVQFWEKSGTGRFSATTLSNNKQGARHLDDFLTCCNLPTLGNVTSMDETRLCKLELLQSFDTYLYTTAKTNNVSISWSCYLLCEQCNITLLRAAATPLRHDRRASQCACRRRVRKPVVPATGG